MVPPDKPVTKPFPSTLATDGFEEVQALPCKVLPAISSCTVLVSLHIVEAVAEAGPTTVNAAGNGLKVKLLDEFALPPAVFFTEI